MNRSEFEDKIKIQTNYAQPAKAEASFGKSKKIAIASAFVLLAIAFGANQWFGFVNFAKGANCISAGSGNWSSITWTNCTGNPGGVPAATDTVTIAAGHTVTLDQDATIAGLTIDVTSLTTNLTHSGTYSLTVNGTVTMNQATTNGASSRWNINAGTATVSGLVTMSGSSTTADREVRITITSGTANFNAGLSTASAGAGNKVLDMTGGAGNLNFKGGFTGNAQLSLLSGTAGATFNYNDTAAQTIQTSFNSGGYHNLKISNSHTSGATQSGSITTTNLTGNLTVATGGIFKQAGTITGNSGKTFAVEGTGIHEMTSGAYPTGFSTTTISITSTTRYYQSGATIVAGTYGHLDIKGGYLATQTFAAGTLTVSGDLTLQSVLAQTYIYADTNDPIINVAGNVSLLGSAIFYASNSSPMTIGGNLTLDGTFVHSNGSIIFNNSSLTSVVAGSGTITFYDFTVDTPGKNMQFLAGKLITFANNVTLKGGAGNLATITSTINGNRWTAAFSAAQTDLNFDYLSVRDSGCNTGTNTRTVINSTDAGNNGTCWSFFSSMTVSGNVYNSKANDVWSGAGKCDGATASLSLSINGGAPQTTTCNASTGAFNFSVAPDSDAMLVIWMNTNGGDKGAVYTRTSLSNITGLKIYKNQTLLRYEMGSSITNSNINVYDNSNDSDIPLASDGVAVSASSGTQITVVSGMTYAPGGNVTTPAIEVAGTYTGASETLTLTSSASSASCTTEPGVMAALCINSGNFSPGTNTVDYTTISNTVITSADYYNVRFVPTSGNPTYTLGAGSYQSFSANTVTMGNGTNSVTLDGSSNSFAIYASNIIVSSSATFNAGNGTIGVSSATNPIVDTGTFNIGTSTIIYNSADSFTVPDLAYYNLQISPGGVNTTHTFASGTYDITNDLTIGNEGGYGGIVDASSNNATINVGNDFLINKSATFLASSNNLTVTGSWANYGVFTAGSGTVVLNSTSNTETLNGSLSTTGKFNNLVLNGTGGEWTAYGDVTIEGDLSVSSGTFVGSGNLTVNGGDIIGDGTVMFAGNHNMTNVVQLSSGVFQTCAINIIGDMYCWGSPHNGMLGDGQSSTTRYTPIRVLKGSAIAADSRGDYLTNIKYVGAGYSTTCAISYSGNTYCWGQAQYGKIGDGQSTTDRTTPVRVLAGAATGSDTDGTYLINQKIITTSYYHVCSIAESGNTYCWGRGSDGMLGDGQSSTDRTTPVKVLKGAATGTETDGTYLIGMRDIAMGTNHTCAAAVTGNTFCWGTPGSGQLGDGQTSTMRTTPVKVLKGAADTGDHDGTYLDNIKYVSSDSSTMCALSFANKMYCWGSASSGQLGDNQTAANRSSPVRVLAGSATGADTDGTYFVNTAKISVGTTHTCAISKTGQAYCWGAGSFGAVGDGNSTQRTTPVKVVKGAAVSGDHDGTYLNNMKEVSTGQYFTCMYSNSGNAYCWGSSGQIGIYTSTSTNASAVRVQSSLTNIKEVSASDAHTCSLSTLNEVFCWGNGSWGQIGDGNTSVTYTAVQVLKGAAASGDHDGTYLTNIKQVITTSNVSCAVSYAENVYCWGYNGGGLLGNGLTSPNANPTPIRVVKGAAASGDNDGTYLSNIIQLASVSSHVCALSQPGNLYCWGTATSGQLGNGLTTPSQTTPVRVLKGVATGSDTDGTYLTNVKQVATGYNHTCAISNSGNTYCWGEVTNGATGDSQVSTARTSPIKVVKGVASGADADGTYLINIRQIMAGGTYTCAVSNSDKAYCWGSGSNGQLGNGSTSQQNSPVRVQDGDASGADSDGTYIRNIRTIAAGAYGHTCAVTKSNIPYCWGAGNRIGTNDSSTYSAPERPLAGAAMGANSSGGFLANIKQTATGGSQFGAGHSMFVTVDGRLYGAGCCNSNMQGQVGDGSGGANILTVLNTVRSVSNYGNTLTTTLNGTGSLGGNTDWKFVDLKLGVSTSGTTTATGTGVINIQGSFVNSSGHTFNAGSKIYTIGDDFTNSGTFTGNTSTATFNNNWNTATIAGTGTTNFFNLQSVTPGKYLQFTSGHTFRVNGSLVVTGSTSDNVNITSTTGNSTWFINHQGTESVSYADISWSGCYSGSSIIDLTNGTNTDSGNNSSCWRFTSFIDRSGGSGPTDGGAGSSTSTGTGDGGDGGSGSTDGGAASGGSSGSGNGGGGGGSFSP